MVHVRGLFRRAIGSSRVVSGTEDAGMIVGGAGGGVCTLDLALRVYTRTGGIAGTGDGSTVNCGSIGMTGSDRGPPTNSVQGDSG